MGTEVGKLYDGGSLYLTLTGVKDYQASKVWEDAADPDHRPAGELQLWRYRAGQSYTHPQQWRLRRISMKIRSMKSRSGIRFMHAILGCISVRKIAAGAIHGLMESGGP